MKRNVSARGLLIAGFAVLFLFSESASAYWVWTPGTKKFINPKNAAKDSPKEQFEWAVGFYNARDYQRAAAEFEKLTKQYEYSEYASKAQYYIGLCYENMNKLYIAFQNYQKAIDNFPHIENMDEIVAREFNIANMFAEKESPKVLGTDIMTSLDRAIEIYRKVVDNAPYGKLAEEAQYRSGLSMKKAERYDEAMQAFQKILDDYPSSQYIDKAKFEVADCAYKASLKPAYDAEPTSRAIKAFEDFSRENRDRSLSKEADKTIQRLKDRAAEKSLLTAQFYEKQGRYQAAIVYYKDVVGSYPDSSFVDLARAKVDVLTSKMEKPKTKMTPLKFTKPQAPKKKAESVPQQTKAKKSMSWNPLSFMKSSKSGESTTQLTAPAEETPKQKAKSWTPLKLRPLKKSGLIPRRGDSLDEGSNPATRGKGMFQGFYNGLKFTKPQAPKEKAESAPKQTKAKKSAGWNPLSFMKSSKSGESTTQLTAPAEETPKQKAKSWTPLNFTKPQAPKEKAESAPKQTKAKKSAGWNPLSFMQSSGPKQASVEQAVKVQGEPKPAVIEQKIDEIKEPAPETEKPSEIRVTSDETEVKTVESKNTEPDNSASANNVSAKQDNPEDQIEKSEQ